MNPRLLIVASVVAALAFAGLLGGYLARDTGSGSNTGDAKADGVVGNDTGFEGAKLPSGVAAPDFQLRDEYGKTVRMSDLRGKNIAVTFLYSHCQDTCPATAQVVRGALDQLGHDIPVVAVSVDPANDTEASARAFLSEQRVTGRIRWALGTRQQLEPIWRAFGTTPQEVQQEHMARLVLIDRRGRQRVSFPMDKATPEMIAHDLRVLEAE